MAERFHPAPPWGIDPTPSVIDVTPMKGPRSGCPGPVSLRVATSQTMAQSACPVSFTIAAQIVTKWQGRNSEPADMMLVV